MYQNFKVFFLFLLLLLAICLDAQNLVINEFSSVNYQFLLDYEGDDPDWIEIFNPSDDTLNLKEFYLSDNSHDLAKWNFPELEMMPNSFLVVFASGKDTVFENGEVHTNFAISSDGEDIFLSHENLLLQHIEFVILKKNQSFGFFPDGSNEGCLMYLPTPGNPNELVDREQICFSKRGGIYDSCFLLELTNKHLDNKIYYTLNGSNPSNTDNLYNGSIVIDSNLISQEFYDTINMTPEDEFYIPYIKSVNSIVVRAAAFDSLGNVVSDVVTNSYFIRELGIDHDMFPIISISAQYDDLFDFYKGIFVPGAQFNPEHPEWTGNYYKRGKDWEREINIEFYEPDNTCGINQIAGLRTHGGNVRLLLQKGLKVYADLEYGIDRFYYKMFEENEYSTYKRLVLKPYYASWSQTGLEDYIANKMAQSINMCGAASRPSVLYINGVYRGIYYVTEKLDEYYLKSKYDIDKDNVQIVENWSGVVDDSISSEFVELYNYIANNDLSIAENYYYVIKKIDIRNFIDYQIIELFIANYDWPVQNMKCWKNHDFNSKWQWIFYDGDAGFNQVDYNMFDHSMDESDSNWPTNAFSTLFYRKLMENSSFKVQFNSRLQELLTDNFDNEKLLDYFSECNSFLQFEVKNHINKFGSPNDYKEWVRGAEIIYEFLIKRHCEFKQNYEKTIGGRLVLPNCEYRSKEVLSSSIYPNPTHDRFTFNITLSHSFPATILLVNSVGNSVVLYNDILLEGENSLDFNDIHLTPGLYIITVFINDEFFSKKLVVN